MNRLKRKAWCTLTAAVMVLAVMLVAGVSFGTFAITVSAANGITYTAKEGTVSSSLPNQSYDKLVDGEYTNPDGTTYCLSFGTGVYVIVEMSEPVVVTGYTLVTGGDTSEWTTRNPESWTLYGCNDETAGKASEGWVALHSVSDDTVLQPADFGQYTYNIDGQKVAYKYLKIEFTKCNGDVMQLAEFIPLYSSCSHVWSASDKLASTCTTDGYTKYACSACNATYQEVLKGGHKFEEGECTVCGEDCTHGTYEEGKCTVCGIACVHTSYNDKGMCVGCGDYQPAQTVSNEHHSELNSTHSGYYAIENEGQLCWFARYVNSDNKSANAVLTDNMDMKDITWTTICETGLYHEAYGDDLGYRGTFDGNGHVISNLTVKSSTDGAASVGLFGTVSGTVKNLGMVTFTLVDGGLDMRAGAIVGQLIKSTGKVSNCYVNGATIETNNRVAGGIAGCVYEGTVENCYVVNATIKGYRWGYVAGDVRADGSNADRPGYVKNCYTDKSTLTSTQKVDANLTDNMTSVTADTFSSGAITYLLNGKKSEGVVWYQTIGTDAYPVLDNTKSIVYYGYDKCKLVYANIKDGLSDNQGEHTWSDGVCSVCETKCTHNWSGNTCTTCQMTCEPHMWSNGVCSVCKIECTHNWSGNTCTICQMTCEQHTWSNGTCTICSKVCGHDYDTNGFCVECGLYELAKTVSDEHHKELSGTHDGYYAIENAGQLYWFAEQVNSGNTTINAVLTADIIVNDGVFSMDGNNLFYGGVAISKANPRVWTPIGNSSNSYKGKFDGNNHTVSGLYYNYYENYVGFFRYVSGSDAEIKNVGIVNNYFKGNYYIGGVCGAVREGGKISNCYNAGIIRGYNGIGGVCGYVKADGKILNCYNTGEIRCEIDYGSYIGGVCGCSEENCVIENSYNAGNVSRGSYIGGVCGHNNNNSQIKNSYNTGSVSGTSYVGGVCGRTADNSVIENSYNIGSVSGESEIGGVCGENTSGCTITNCYYNSVNSIVNISTNNGTATYVEGKTTDEFASGEVAYLLNGTVTDGEWATDGTQSWYQNLSGTAADVCPVLDSRHGTVYKVEKYACTNPEELLGEGYSNTYEEGYKLKVHTGEVIDGYCDACAYAADPIGVHLAGYSLSLDGNIGVNFYMALDASVLSDDTAYMQFTLPNKAEPVKVMVNDVEASTVTVSDKKYYVFTCEVAAKEMADTITAQMFCESGTKSGTVYTYSVEYYAKALIDREGAESKAGKLAKALLNYGAYAEIYFEGNTSIKADTPSVTITKNIYDTYKASVTDNSDKVEYLGSTLLLESKIKVRHYFSTDAVTAEAYGLEEYNAGIYYYESDGIAAVGMGTRSACTVDELTVNYSPMSYVVTVLSNVDKNAANAQELVDDTDLQNLMKALYLYYEAVVNYNAN